MKIEKIDDNKLKIFLSKQDLLDKNIDLYRLSKNSFDTQEIFWDILHEAEMTCDFDLSDSQILVEGNYSVSEGFILTVTKIGNGVNIENNSLRHPPELKVRRKEANIENNVNIYMFNSFEDFVAFSNKFKRFPQKYINTLFKYNDKYFLVLYNLNENKKLQNKVHFVLSEYSNHIQNSSLFESRLIEYGEVIIENNAIQKINKYY
ncbi:MAG: adaptor protein MecA [Clostridiales bacterium]|nr:adaptor protein MecA [Clostridiales bacterium]